MKLQRERGRDRGIDSSSNDLPESHARGSEGTPSGLEGVWQVERAGGLLPPMAGVWKRIEGAQGETRIGSLIGWTFSVEPRGEGFAMVYRPTFSAFVDEVRTGLPSGLAIPKPSGSPERAEEEAMAARISENWDRFLDLTLREQGLLPHSS